jgi:hypothetical protein
MGSLRIIYECAIHSRNYALRTAEQLLCGILLLTFV